MSKRADRSGRARSVARRLAMQALYQWQLTHQSVAELRNQFATDEAYPDADREYFAELLQQVVDASAALDDALGLLIDRPVAQLDPVEHAVLMIGIHELRNRTDVPFKVVISEAVELAKRFGATEGHKFVNAVLDRAARQIRAAEQAATAHRGAR